MKRFLLVTIISWFSLASAQGFNFGVGFGFLRQDAEGNVVVSVPVNLPVTNLGKVNLGLRTTTDFVISAQPDVSLLLSPIFSYTLRPTDFTPITVYGGPSIRLFIDDAFASTRQTSWSFAGGVAGVSLSLAGVVVPYGEATWSVTPTGTVFSLQSGLGFRLGL